jgi:hypothetical protein
MPRGGRARRGIRGTTGALIVALGSPPASAAPLTWEELPARAAEAWAAGPGAAWTAEVAGLEAAAAASPWGPSAVWVTAQQGLPGQNQLTAAVDLPLRGPGPAASAARAAAGTRGAAGDAGARAFRAELQELWLQAWVAREMDLHLGAYEAEVGAWLSPLEAAVGAGLAPALDLADLRAEFTTLQGERAAAVAAALQAEARLGARLGAAVEADTRASHLHGGAPPPAQNPWPALAGRGGEAPGARAAAADARAADADGRAIRAGRAPVAQLGVAVMDLSPAGDKGPMAYAGLSLPLASGARADQAEASGRAEAARARARWAAAAFEAEVTAEAAAWEAERARLARLEAGAFAALEARAQALEAAFAARQVPAARLIRARRDLHEAEHEMIVILAALRHSEARASALAAPPASERP